MRLILAGTRSFGATVLGELVLAGHDVAGVIAPLGDKTHDAARRARLPVAEQADAWWIKRRGVDLIVAAHSHAFLGRKSRAATRLGALGYHPSLLPRHRGRDAVRWTVAMGDAVAGGSVYWFNESVDGGPVAAQDWCFTVPGQDHRDLWRERLFPMGVELLLRVLKDLDGGRIVAVPQDARPGVATWEPSWGRPPLHRPEVPELGSGPAGFEVIANRGAEK